MKAVRFRVQSMYNLITLNLLLFLLLLLFFLFFSYGLYLFIDKGGKKRVAPMCDCAQKHIVNEDKIYNFDQFCFAFFQCGRMLCVTTGIEMIGCVAFAEIANGCDVSIVMPID